MDDYEWKLTIRPGRKGGPGSGNFGHAGRPGQVGGSGPGKGGGSSNFSTAASSGGIENQRYLGGGAAGAELLEYTDDGSGVWKKMSADYGNHDGNSEVAAYRISKLFADDLVPETVYAQNRDNQEGTSQLLIEGAQDGFKVKRDKDRILASNEDRVEQMVLLDYIIGNEDRHDGNWIVDSAGKVWAIDHGHAAWKGNWGGFNLARDHLPAFGHTRSEGTGWERNLSLSPSLKKKVMGITRDVFFGSMNDVSTERNVNLEKAWRRLERIQDKGGVIDWGNF